MPAKGSRKWPLIDGCQRCSKCAAYKPLEAFARNKNAQTGRCGYCRDCANARTAQWVADNIELVRARRNNPDPVYREQRRIQALRFYYRTKQKLFDGYGNACSCCGETQPGFLALDHVNGGGKAHRAAVGSSIQTWRAAIKEGFPPTYRLLCHNCNIGRQTNVGNPGVCPHKDPESNALHVWGNTA